MSSMVKQDHMKDLCGSIRARELVKCASFEFSSQLTEKKSSCRPLKNMCHLQKNGFITAPILFHNCRSCKSIVFFKECYLILGKGVFLFFSRHTVGILCYIID